MSAHWTVEENNNYADDYLSGWIIRYDPTPGGRKNEDGTTSYSMTAPALAVTSWIGDPENAANEVARDLNEVDTLRADNERLRAAAVLVLAERRGENLIAHGIRDNAVVRRALVQLEAALSPGGAS